MRARRTATILRTGTYRRMEGREELKDERLEGSYMGAKVLVIGR